MDGEASAKVDAEPGDYVSLEVADTGHGMTAEMIEQSVEPFFTTKDVGEGTGLGLSVVYGFAKQAGGYIEIDSDVGRGTTVRLCLPVVGTSESVAQGEEPSPRKAGPARATILVVEDDPDVRSLVMGLLIDLGYDAVEAADGRSAMARLDERSDIDLLFTDIVLPHGVSGSEIAHDARRRNPELKVVFTSGYSDRDHGDLSVDGKVPAIISKPYRRSELAEVLASVLDS